MLALQQNKKNIIFINSHPIQYFAPLYEYMEADKDLDLKVYYCSNESIRGVIDKQFGVDVKWDIPLLEKYRYNFLKNYSWKPSIKNGFFGLINLGIIYHLFRVQKSYIVIPGWQYFSYVFTLVVAKIARHKVCLRMDNPLIHERYKKSLKNIIRAYVVKNVIFKMIDYGLYVGEENKDYYLYYGMPISKLIFTPHSIDSRRFQNFYKLKESKQSIKQKLNLPLEKKIILFSGKYISKKRPLDVIRAFAKIPRADKCLVMVGEGELRPQMEQLIEKLNLTNVYLTGFVNQSQIPLYYAVADIFVMFSDVGETWGLSTNEAMNFALPVVLSDLTGCARDLVAEGENGFIVKTGDIEALADKLTLFLQDDESRIRAGQKSLEKIQQYSYEVIIENFKTYLI